MKDTKFQEKVEHYMRKPYRVEIEPDPDGGYVAWIKELPGCVTYGDTIEETFEMLEEAKRLYIETAIERGKKLPEPLSERKYSGRFVVRISPSLHRKLAELAAEEGVSLNSLINSFLSSSASQLELTRELMREVESLKREVSSIKSLLSKRSGG